MRWPRSLHAEELIDKILYPIDDYLKVRSELFLLLKHQFHTLLMAWRLTAEYFPVEVRRSEAASARWGVTADVFAEIAATATAHGAGAMFVLVPASFQVDSTEFEEYRRGFGVSPTEVDLDQPNCLLTAALRARGVVPLDALPYFRRLAASGQKLYGEVDKHLSPDGHLALERVAERAVLSLLERPQRRSGVRALSRAQ